MYFSGYYVDSKALNCHLPILVLVGTHVQRVYPSDHVITAQNAWLRLGF